VKRRTPRHRPEDAAPYELIAPRTVAPPLSGQVVVRPDVDRVIDALAADLVIHAENCVREFGDFHVALSAGPEFERLYTRLMYDPNYRRIPWRRTHLWFVHERCVPRDDERSSYRMIREILGDHADIPPEQFHPIDAGAPRPDADYESLIRDVLAWREKGQDRLDYVLLTMGAGGETAGMPPDAAAFSDDPADGDEPPPGEAMSQSHRLVRRVATAGEADRIALAPSFLNVARLVAVLVTGAAAADAVERLARRAAAPGEMPISKIAPVNGELKWYLDALACGAGGEEPRR